MREHTRDFTTERYLPDLGNAATARALATRAELAVARGRATASTPAGADPAPTTNVVRGEPLPSVTFAGRFRFSSVATARRYGASAALHARDGGGDSPARVPIG